MAKKTRDQALKSLINHYLTLETRDIEKEGLKRVRGACIGLFTDYFRDPLGGSKALLLATPGSDLPRRFPISSWKVVNVQ